MSDPRLDLREPSAPPDRRRIWVVKIGGRLCERAEDRARFALACAAQSHPIVVVHGGGDSVSRMQSKLGLEPRFESGRRITSEEEIEVVEMVLSGTVNAALVRALESAGRPAVGITGSDAGFVRCDRIEGLGCVGAPRQVEPRLLHVLLDAGYTPVVSPVAVDDAGQPLNVNADESAAAIAVALGAARLLFVSDVDGVSVDEAWQREIEIDAIEALIASGAATGGMIPKLRAARAAVAGGVGEVRIAAFDAASFERLRGTRLHAPAETSQPGGPSWRETAVGGTS